MFVSIATILADALSLLATSYWICLIVGGGLIAISTIFGSQHGGDVDVGGDVDGGLDLGGDVAVAGDAGFDADISADVDVGVDADVSAEGGGIDVDHAGALSLASWFSTYFVVYFMAAFGAVGVVLTNLSEVGGAATVGYAMLGGLIVGQSVHQILRALRLGSGNSALRQQDYINKIARVTVMIEHPRQGEIALQPVRGERFIPAVARHPGTIFRAGEQVGVVAYRGGVAEVVSREEFEFLANKNKGDLA